MTRGVYSPAVLVFALLLACPSARAQSAGALSITAQVRASVLFFGTTPAGAAFVQGGESNASTNLSLLAMPVQSFSSRAIAANAPDSTGYELVATLASPTIATVTVDGVQLSTSETVITPHASYGGLQPHQVMVSDPAVAPSVVITLTCRPL